LTKVHESRITRHGSRSSSLNSKKAKKAWGGFPLTTNKKAFILP
jgi:hypothetical protein